jgi:hypothetical protein
MAAFDRYLHDSTRRKFSSVRAVFSSGTFLGVAVASIVRIRLRHYSLAGFWLAVHNQRSGNLIVLISDGAPLVWTTLLFR